MRKIRNILLAAVLVASFSRLPVLFAGERDGEDGGSRGASGPVGLDQPDEMSPEQGGVSESAKALDSDFRSGLPQSNPTGAIKGRLTSADVDTLRESEMALREERPELAEKLRKIVQQQQ